MTVEDAEGAQSGRDQLLTEPMCLDIGTGSADVFGALMPTVRMVLMPDGTLRWIYCDVPMGPKIFPSTGVTVVAEE